MKSKHVARIWNYRLQKSIQEWKKKIEENKEVIENEERWHNPVIERLKEMLQQQKESGWNDIKPRGEVR